MIISAPMNESELRNLMYTAQLESNKHPFVIRYPRGEGVMPDWRTPMEAIAIGKGRTLKEGEEIAILSLGHPGNFAAAALRELRTDGLNPGHYDMRFVKPLDEELLHHICGRYQKILTVEDGTIKGGFGSAILEFMAEHGYKLDLHRLGIPDVLVEHGTPAELHRECGYDTAAIVKAVRQLASVQVSEIN